MGTETQHLPRWGLCSWGGGASLSPGRSPPGSRPGPLRPLEAAGRAVLGGDVASSPPLCAQQSGAAACPSVSATPGPAPARPSGTQAPLWGQHFSRLLRPLVLTPPSLRGGLCPETQPFTLCALCPDQTLPLGTGQGFWVLEHDGPPTPRHSDVWDRAQGLSHATWAGWERSDPLPALPSGARVGGRCYPACSPLPSKSLPP